MKIRSQVGMVLNLDKCIGCHTCSITCKNVWTSREGMEYAWFNNVETKPGIGYPKEWENQDKWKGGWVRNGDGTMDLQFRKGLFKSEGRFNEFSRSGRGARRGWRASGGAAQLQHVRPNGRGHSQRADARDRCSQRWGIRRWQRVGRHVRPGDRSRELLKWGSRAAQNNAN